MLLFDHKAFAGDAAAAGVVADLDAARWRRARDAAKDLAKKDKERYGPLVVAANAGLAHEMLSRGLKKDAEPVLAMLEKTASTEVLAWVRGGEAALPVTAAAPAAAVKNFGAESWALVVALAAELEAGGPGPDTGWRAADLLAGATRAPTAPPEAAAVEAEWRQVQRAVEAAGEGQWDSMQEALRGLPRTSVFQHWRMLLRGVRAVHTEEREAAARCFAALPAGSAPARASVPWRQWLGENAGASPAAAADAVLGAMCQVPPVWIEACRNADGALRKGRRREVWKILRQAMKDDFPSPQPDFAGECTRVALHTRPPSTPAEEKEYDALLDLVDADNAARRFKNTPGHLAALLFYANGMEPVLHHGDLESLWTGALQMASKVWGPLPLRDAAAWRRLSQHFIQPQERGMLGLGSIPVFYGVKPKPHDEKAARRVLERALNLDPANVDAAMDLVALLDMTGDTSARNKLLDALVKRAPQNRLVLLKAGALAIERKAFGKGLDMLRQARALDPLDVSVAVGIAAGLIGQARDRQKKRPSASQDDLWQELETLAVDRCDRSDPLHWHPMLLERWALRVRRSLLDAGHGAVAEAEAERMAASPFGCLLLRGMLSELYLKRQPTAEENTRLEKAGASAAWGDLHEALHLWCHARQIPGFNRLTELRWMQPLLHVAGSPALAPDDAWGAWRVAVFLQEANISTFRGVMQALQKKLVRHISGAAKKKNADVRLAVACMIMARDYDYSADRQHSGLMEKAKAAGLNDVVRALQCMGDRYGFQLPPAVHDDDRFEEDEDALGGPDGPSILDDALVGRAFLLIDQVEGATEAQLDALCARLVAEGLDQTTAQDVIGLALAMASIRASGPGFPPAPPRIAKPKAAKSKPAKKLPPPSDTRQPDLF